MLFFFNIYFYLFTWLYQVLVLAFGIFSCSMWNLVPWPGIEPRPPALGARNLTHWTTRKVPMLILELHEYSLFSFFSIQHKVSSTSVILLQISWCGMFILQLVYKVKSNDILEKLALSSLDTSEQTEWQKLVNEAKENLHKIQVCFPCCILEYSDWWTDLHCVALPCLAFMQQDDEFVMNYCLEAQWITYETTHEMLNYAKTRVSFSNVCPC